MGEGHEALIQLALSLLSALSQQRRPRHITAIYIGDRPHSLIRPARDERLIGKRRVLGPSH
jgi:hypothetical protein